jgi:hypothetical protein
MTDDASRWLAKLESALFAWPAMPADEHVLNAVRSLLLAMPRNYKSSMLPRLVREHVDSQLSDFFRNLKLELSGPVGRLSSLSKAGRRDVRGRRRSQLQLIRREVDAGFARRVADYLRSYQLSLRIDLENQPLSVRKTIDNVADAFAFISRIPVKSRRELLEGNMRWKHRVTTRDLTPYERCKRCGGWTERYSRSIDAPAAVRESKRLVDHTAGYWKGFPIELHEPLPRRFVCHGSDEFCASCANSSIAYKSREEFAEMSEGLALTNELRARGLWTAGFDTRCRLAVYLTRPQFGRVEAERRVAHLRSIAGRVHEAVEEFFGVQLPEDIGIRKGVVCELQASRGDFVSTQVMTGEMHRLPSAVDHHHAEKAVSRGLRWCGIRHQPTQQSIRLDIPGLGLILEANAGEFWSITAIIDVSTYYDWLPAYFTRKKAERALAGLRKREAQMNAPLLCPSL